MEPQADPSATASQQLSQPKRLVTDHNSDGKAVFNTTYDENVAAASLPGIVLYDAFISPQHPIQMNDGADIKAGREWPQTTSLCPPGATVARYVDFLPGKAPIYHRTVSMDFAVVVVGEVELLLDSGESKVLRVGDSVVQRGTEHAWRNTHPTNTARIFFVQSSSEPVVIQGKGLEEHIDWPDA